MASAPVPRFHVEYYGDEYEDDDIDFDNDQTDASLGKLTEEDPELSERAERYFAIRKKIYQVPGKGDLEPISMSSSGRYQPLSETDPCVQPISFGDLNHVQDTSGRMGSISSLNKNPQQRVQVLQNLMKQATFNGGQGSTLSMGSKEALFTKMKFHERESRPVAEVSSLLSESSESWKRIIGGHSSQSMNAAASDLLPQIVKRLSTFNRQPKLSFTVPGYRHRNRHRFSVLQTIPGRVGIPGLLEEEDKASQAENTSEQAASLKDEHIVSDKASTGAAVCADVTKDFLCDAELAQEASIWLDANRDTYLANEDDDDEDERFPTISEHTQREKMVTLVQESLDVELPLFVKKSLLDLAIPIVKSTMEEYEHVLGKTNSLTVAAQAKLESLLRERNVYL